MNGDRELDRLLREYREELRGQAPSPSVLDRVRQAQRPPGAVLSIEQRKPRPAVWRLGGLALAASLLLAFGIYRSLPVQPAPVLTAELQKPAQAQPAPIESNVAPSPGPVSVPRATVAPPPPASPAVDPSAPPSIRAALAIAEKSALERKEIEGRELERKLLEKKPLEKQPAEAAAPLLADRGSEAEDAGGAKKAKAEVAAAAGKAVEAPVTLQATVLREVFEPGQPARSFTGTYQRLADGREVRTALLPSDEPAFAQNSQQQVAAPSQQVFQVPQAAPSLREQRRLSAPRDSVGDANRSRIGGSQAPQNIVLPPGLIEGCRCTGTRTTDNHRTVERWHCAELGLDLLVRTVEANGSTVVVRYVKIERR